MNRKYLIGEVAKALDISNDTLRYYHKLKIVSPSKDENNGYRYYTYEDIVKLYYVIALKNLDMPLNTIKELINNCDIDTLKSTIEKQETIIDKRINDLLKFKNTIINFKNDLNKAKSLLNSFDTIPSPYFIYKKISNDISDEFIKSSKELENSGLIEEMILSSFLSKDSFYSNTDNYLFISIACGIKNENIDESQLKYYCTFHHSKCLHTIIKTTIDFSNNELNQIKQYLDKNNISICGDIMLNYIGFECKDNITYDLVEMWIPIE